jgi:hypothetical protein
MCEAKFFLHVTIHQAMPAVGVDQTTNSMLMSAPFLPEFQGKFNSNQND